MMLCVFCSEGMNHLFLSIQLIKIRPLEYSDFSLIREPVHIVSILVLFLGEFTH